MIRALYVVQDVFEAIGRLTVRVREARYIPMDRGSAMLKKALGLFQIGPLALTHIAGERHDPDGKPSHSFCNRVAEEATTRYGTSSKQHRPPERNRSVNAC